jgi:hypothetical protein
MGRIDDAIRNIEGIEDGTERALQLAGLISTLFKLKGVVLVVTGQLAFDSYANTSSTYPEVELAPFAGDLAPRTVLEIMRAQVYGTGTLYQWTVAGIPVRFQHETVIANREMCREFTTDHGVVKLLPVEEIAADCILASVYPELNSTEYDRAHQLLLNGLSDVFHMDWTALHGLCHRPDYRVGEQLAQMRLEAKREADAAGRSRDHIGETSMLPSIVAPAEGAAPSAPVSDDAGPSPASENDGITGPLPTA